MIGLSTWSCSDLNSSSVNKNDFDFARSDSSDACADSAAFKALSSYREP